MERELELALNDHKWNYDFINVTEIVLIQIE